MKKLKNILLVVIICCSQLFIRCSNDENVVREVPTEKYSDEVVLLRTFLSHFHNIPLDKIVYSSQKSSFILDHDMLIPIDQVRELYENSKKKN